MSKIRLEEWAYLAVGSDIDIDDIFKGRRMREENPPPPEKSAADISRETERARQDTAVGAAVGRVWSLPRGN